METVALFAKTDYVSRNGTVPIYLRLTIHRKVYPIRLEYRVHPQQWDDLRREVKPVNTLCSKMNLLLQRELMRANEILLDMKIRNRPITYEAFYNDFIGCNAYDYYNLVADYLASNKATFSFSYREKVRHVTNKLHTFKPDLLLHQIDYSFLKSYQQYMIGVRKNGKNTVHSNFRIMRRILNEAIKIKLLKENPFNFFKLEKAKVDRETLNVAELVKYEDLVHRPLPYYLHKTLCWFLLACYTGRRYGDIVHYRDWVFYDDYIKIVADKRTTGRDEGKTVIVYMNDRIRKITALIDEKKYEPLTNAKANKFLKEVNAMAGITKHITFHCARHTFNHVHKELSADLALRKDLMGHDSIKSTMIYDHVDEGLMKSAMLKWNGLK